VRDKKEIGCRVADYGDDDFEIVVSGERWRHVEKVGRKYVIVSSGDNRMKCGQI